MTYFAQTKTGRLKKPASLKGVPHKKTNLTINCHGLPLAKVGDFVFQTGCGISAGTVGRIIKIDPRWSIAYNSPNDPLHLSAEFECLNGKIESTWLWYLTAIDYDAVQEVKDFYIADGRPDRIKVTW